MEQKKIAVINDISGYGRCSLTVTLPVISKMKVQCCPLPTAILSNHTAFPYYFFDDYTEKMPRYMEAWEKLGLSFSGIYTGFLGSKEQIEIVTDFIRKFAGDDTVVIVDPVMGDHGKAYITCTPEMCEEMKKLVRYAQILTPNVTEACILTDTPYKEKWQKKEIRKMAEKLLEQGPSKVVITGIPQGEFIANYVCEKKEPEIKEKKAPGDPKIKEKKAPGDPKIKEKQVLGNPEIRGQFLRSMRVGTQRCGTGDLFASIIAADAVKGADFFKSVKKASNFVKKCIQTSIEMDIPLTDGVAFEEVLDSLK